MTLDPRPYTILPYRFMRFGNEVLLVNEAGEYIFLSEDEYSRLRNFKLGTKDEVFLNLKNKHTVTDTDRRFRFIF